MFSSEFIAFENLFDSDDDLPLWLRKSNETNDAIDVNDEKFEEFVAIDDKISCWEVLTDDQIILNMKIMLVKMIQ